MTLQVRANLTRSNGFALQVDTRIETDRVTAVFGPSGCGKSTLLRLIAGLEHNPNVRVQYRDTVWQNDTSFVPPHRRNIGYVFQHNNLFPHLSVTGNLNFAEARQRRTPDVSRSEVIEMLELASLLEQSPESLSGGEQQRVAIARVLLSGPDLIVMDEPLGSIDSGARHRILPYLQRLNTQLQIPIVYVSHALDEIQFLADDVIALEAGKIVQQQSVLSFSTSELGMDQPSASAIIQCQVVAHDSDYQLTEVSFEDNPLFLSADHYEPGDVIRIRIPARDVSVTRSRIEQSSIVNVIEAKIVDISLSDNGPSCLLKLAVGDQNLLARITRKSLTELNLAMGDALFAQIKGVALMSDYER